MNTGLADNRESVFKESVLIRLIRAHPRPISVLQNQTFYAFIT